MIAPYLTNKNGDFIINCCFFPFDMVIQDNLINKNGDVGLGTTEFRAGFMAMKFTVEHDDQP